MIVLGNYIYKSDKVKRLFVDCFTTNHFSISVMYTPIEECIFYEKYSSIQPHVISVFGVGRIYCYRHILKITTSKGERDMTRKKQPKYNIGDIVVITLYGTVGKITNIKMLDGVYVYEVNNHDGFYVEHTLQLVTEQEMKDGESEWIELHYKFTFGDLVQVTGYEKDVFRVVGYRTEVWRYKNDAWEDTIYELSRITDGEWLEADESDLTLIANAQTANVILKKIKQDKAGMNKLDLGKLKSINNSKKVSIKTNRKEIIDGLLDIFNDYRTLYETFQDEEYKIVMEVVRNYLIKLSEKK